MGKINRRRSRKKKGLLHNTGKIGKEAVNTTVGAGKFAVGAIRNLIILIGSLPLLFNLYGMIMLVAVIFIGAAGLVSVLQPPKQEETVNEKLLNWNHKCTCTFLSEEDIAIVKAGGSVNAGNNNGSLNVPGGGASGTVDATRGLSGYMWGDFPMELFFLSTTSELGLTEAAIRQVAGDPVTKGGRDYKAYGLMQMDYRHTLADFMKKAYQGNPVAWAGLAKFQSANNNDRDLIGNQEIIDAFLFCYDNYTSDYLTMQVDFFVTKFDAYEKALALGVDLDKRHISVRAALISASINAGSNVLKDYIVPKGFSDSQSDEDMIRSIYAGWKAYRATKTDAGSKSMLKDGHRLGSEGTGGEIDLALEVLRGSVIPSSTDITGSGGGAYKYTDWCKGWVSSIALKLSHSGTTPPSTGTTGGTTNNTPTTGTTGGVIYTDGQKISLDASWEYANESKINTGAATYYLSTGGTRKNICVTVNAGHGTSGGSSVKTKSHPDGTPKVTGGTTASGEVLSTSISSGTTFLDGKSEASVNLVVAQKLKGLLLSNGYDVLMIRETDNEQLDNIARTVISNYVSDAHVAIHFDSSTSDKGVFYMSVPNIASYRNMEPVKSNWQSHNDLGDALVSGLVSNGLSKWGSGSMEMDLTQTSYSTIPSSDIELGDTKSPNGDTECQKFAEGLLKGIDIFFQSNQPKNQARRAGQNIGSSTGGSGSGTTGGSSGGSGNNSGGIVNNNLDNLRTSCSMKSEGLCGCYISDPGCACHIFAGPDGIAGTTDDGVDSGTGGGTTGNLSGKLAIYVPSINTVSQEAIKSIQTKYPGRYESVHLYAGPNSRYIGYSVPVTVTSVLGDTKTLNVRPDCSGFVCAVIYAISGLDLNNTNTTGIQGACQGNGKFIQSDAFIVLPFDKNTVEPCDIVVRGNGHTEIFLGWLDDTKTGAYAMSWGSNERIREHVVDGAGATDTMNNPWPNWPTQSYNYTIRYVGTGGAGK